MRLVNADEVYKVLTDYYHHRTEIQHEALKEAIGRVPTVDAVPIVRCKDCQWWNNNDGNCSVNEGLWLTTNFCSWGLRREDGDAEID